MSIPAPGLLHVIIITKSIHNFNVQCREVLDNRDFTILQQLSVADDFIPNIRSTKTYNNRQQVKAKKPSIAICSRSS